MVSQRVPPASRERILSAAATEFAARGFDGTKVDRIAARARLNKAMLYYHFGSKAALYQAILIDLFRSVADAATAGRDPDADPAEQIRGFIRVLATQIATRPHFPAIWLREMADGGRHVDVAIVAELRRVLDLLGGILADGQRQGVFGPAHPMLTHMAITGPLLLFAASAPARARFGQLVPAFAPAAAPADAIVRHVETATLAALAPVTARGGASRRAAAASHPPLRSSRR